MIKLLIADDHDLFREGIQSLLKNKPDIDVAGTASDGVEAIEKVRELRPDVVLMDVTMPNMNGIAATGKITAEFPDIAVVVLSMHNDRRFIAETLRAGAKGYLLKESSSETVIEAIKSVYAGDYFLSSKATTVLIGDYLRLLRSDEDKKKQNPLSERETEVLLLLVKGCNSRQISERLSISKNTVDTHRRRILEKLKCTSVAELTKYAIKEGFLTL